MPSPYTFIALTFCIDPHRRVLLAQESRPDCRGMYYVPAGRGHPGEDPMRIAWRVTAEKTGLSVEPTAVLGVEHNPPIGQFPGQLRVFVLAQFREGTLKRFEDEHSIGAIWVPYEDIRGLKLRSSDILPWMDDAVSGHAQMLPAAYWRTLGAPV